MTIYFAIGEFDDLECVYFSKEDLLKDLRKIKENEYSIYSTDKTVSIDKNRLVYHEFSEFEKEVKEQEEYKEYLRLKEKFEKGELIMTIEEKAEKEYLNESENDIYHDMEIQEDVLKLRIENEQLKKNDVEKAFKVLMDNGNLYFEDYEGKVSPISYCNIDKYGDIVFN